jgi:uncharacterized membrane protein YraQ (UPF0718 family)
MQEELAVADLTTFLQTDFTPILAPGCASPFLAHPWGALSGLILLCLCGMVPMAVDGLSRGLFLPQDSSLAPISQVS